VQFSLPIFAICGGLGLLFIIKGDIPSIKRIAVLPSSFGVLAFTALAVDEKRGFKRTWMQRRHIIPSLIIILLMTSMLAVPRIAADGGVSPLDKYASESETAEADWAYEFGSDCLLADDVLSGRVPHLRHGHRLPVGDSKYKAIVYNSGDTQLSCTSMG
jgi:hypothetical protein